MIFRDKYSVVTFLIFVILILISSCAVQQPPTGGDDDKTPPKIITVFPSNNTVNYKGNTVEIEFDEYVDRRSFMDALLITPRPKGELEFEWSGKSVEISIKGGFEQNRTYLFTVGKGFKDLRGGNHLSEPYSFAFATGPKIDNGRIEGRVFDFKGNENDGNTFRDVVMIAYITESGREINPETDQPDFVLPVNSDGSFSFSNLPENEFLVFALLDLDRNNLYDKQFEAISIPNSRIKVMKNKLDFPLIYLLDINPDYITRNIYGVFNSSEMSYSSSESGLNYLLKKMSTDSTGYLYTSLAGGDAAVPVNSHIFLYFKNNIASVLDIIGAISLKRKDNEVKNLLNYNWYNDSLLGISYQQPLLPSVDYVFSYSLSVSTISYSREIEFKTIPQRNLGSLKTVLTGEDNLNYVLCLINKIDDLFFIKRETVSRGSLSFDNIPEGRYIIFVFEDKDKNGMFTMGSYFPFRPSERFFLSSLDIRIRGGWTIENYIIKF